MPRIAAALAFLSILSVLSSAQEAGEKSPVPTFADQVGPMIHARCAGCHRPGQAGPFSLLSHEDVAKRAKMVLSVVEDRYMPPWHPVEGHGEFRDVRQVTPYYLQVRIITPRPLAELPRFAGNAANEVALL